MIDLSGLFGGKHFESKRLGQALRHGAEAVWSVILPEYLISVFGTKLPNWNVRSAVAIGGKPDMTRTSLNCRD